MTRSEEEHVVVLHEEQTVAEEVRKERIDVDGDKA